MSAISFKISGGTLTIDSNVLAPLFANATFTPTPVANTTPVSNTTPVANTTPVSNTTPVANTSSASWVYYKGKFNWAGDWSDVTMNYSSNGSLGVDGVSNCIEMPSGAEWEYWLPYPPTNSAAPASNGIGYDLTGKTYFTIAIKPTQAGAAATMGFYTASGTTDDIPAGNSVTINSAAYGPATMVANQWNVYKIPLTAFGLTGWIYKFMIQQQGTTPQVWYIDQVGFE